MILYVFHRSIGHSSQIVPQVSDFDNAFKMLKTNQLRTVLGSPQRN